jgi:hypothetical protein
MTETHKKVSIGELEGWSSLDRIRRAWEDMLECIFKRKDGRVLTGVIWLMTDIGGGHLRTR